MASPEREAFYFAKNVTALAKKIAAFAKTIALSRRLWYKGWRIRAKVVEELAERDAKGRFLKGVSGNPRGRTPLPPKFADYAKQAPERLRAICDDPATPVKVRADIERWFAEMYFGKSPQALDLDGKLNVEPVVFSGSDEIAD